MAKDSQTRKRGRPRHDGCFTPAEQRLLPFLSEGLTNAEIAARTGLSVNTVHTHVANMLSKSGVADRHELAGVARDATRPSAWLGFLPLRLVGISLAGIAAATVVVALVASAIASIRSDGEATQPAGPTLATGLTDRPLAFPTVAAGAACPQSDLHTVPNLGPGRGPGPAYLVIGTGSFYVGGNARPAKPYDRWGQAKAFLYLAPPHARRALVRGGRIDGVGPILFGQVAGNWTRDMTTDLLAQDSGWSGNVFRPIVEAPGCYAIQVDGQGFSEVIVFEVVFACADRGDLLAPIPTWPNCP